MAREPVTFAHPTGIRTWGKLGCKLPLWRFTFQIILDRRGTKLWKKMPSPSNKPASSALSGTVWFLERPNFIEGFAAIPPMEKAEDRKCWRRERNWGRTFSTQASVVQRTLAKRSVWRRQRNWAPTISRTISLELVPFRHIKSSGMWTARNFCLHSGTALLVKKKRLKCWLFCPRFCARRSARSVAIRTASMLFGQHQSFARQRWTLPAAP